jgi:hypothetical protein
MSWVVKSSKGIQGGFLLLFERFVLLCSFHGMIDLANSSIEVWHAIYLLHYWILVATGLLDSHS